MVGRASRGFKVLCLGFRTELDGGQRMMGAIHQLHCSQILKSQCARTFSVHHDHREYFREYVPAAWAERPRVGRPSMNSITSCLAMPPLHRALPHAAMSTIRILPDASARTVSPRPAWACVRALRVKVMQASGACACVACQSRVKTPRHPPRGISLSLVPTSISLCTPNAHAATARLWPEQA